MPSRKRAVQQNDRRQAANALRKLLDAIERGEIDASDPRARRLHRQIEGAAAAWEVEDREWPPASAGTLSMRTS